MRKLFQASMVAMLGALVIVSLGRCGTTTSGADVGTIHKDGGPPAGLDAALTCSPTCTGTLPNCTNGVCVCTKSPDSCGSNMVCANNVCVGTGDPCALKVCSGTTPKCVASGATANCVCSTVPDSCGANWQCNASGACQVVQPKCQTVTCNQGETCDEADGFCKCTGPGTQGSCPATYVCTTSLLCVLNTDPCATANCTGTTPVCVSGACKCRTSPDSCGTGQQCNATSLACEAAAGRDAGPVTGVDTGVVTHETTIPVINYVDDPGHAAFGTVYTDNKVHFKGVAMSPIFMDYISAANGYCRKGIYLADATAPALHNGVLLISESTTGTLSYDAGAGNVICNADSPLEKVNALTPIAIGDELDVTGFYKGPGVMETCSYDSASHTCIGTDSNNKPIFRAVVTANGATSIVRTGLHPGVPAGLPVSVTLTDIASGTPVAATAPYYTVPLGSKFMDYRQVLVKVSNVKAIDVTTPKSCNWIIQDQGGAGPTLIVQDDVMYLPSCGAKPAVNTAYSSITGFETFYSYFTSSVHQGEAQIGPRFFTTDLVP